jgi:RNA polymerase sigma factor (sigma-70 family)
VYTLCVTNEWIYSMKDDKDLVKEIRDGSYQSYSILYDKWVSSLFRYVYSFVKSTDETKDIVQETFVRVWTNRKNLNPDFAFKSYLFTISYHLLLHEFSRQINNPLMEDYVEYCNEQACDSAADKLLDFSSFQEDLLRAKSKLSPRLRQIFEMNKEYNLPVKDIADKLSLDEQSVRNQLSSALKIVRKELSQYSFLLSMFVSL